MGVGQGGAGKLMFVVEAKTATINVGPYGFWRYGAHFLKARKRIRVEKAFSPVPYYLICRCIELELKAFLLAKGRPMSFLKNKIRHDLEKALRVSEAEGLSRMVRITPKRRGELRAANAYYAAKGFEYFQVLKAVTGYPNLPDLRILDRFGAALVERLKQPCRDAA